MNNLSLSMVPAARWGDALLVRAFRPRMICTACGIIGADARPNWREMQASGNVATTTLEIEARFGKALWKNHRARSSAIMHNPESHAKMPPGRIQPPRHRFSSHPFFSQGELAAPRLARRAHRRILDAPANLPYLCGVPLG